MLLSAVIPWSTIWEMLLSAVILSVWFSFHLTLTVLLCHFSEKCDFMIKPFTAFAWRVYAPLDRTEKLFMKMTNIFTMVNQVCIKWSASYEKYFSGFTTVSSTHYVLCMKLTSEFSHIRYPTTDVNSFLIPLKINIICKLTCCVMQGHNRSRRRSWSMEVYYFMWNFKIITFI